MTEKNRIQKYFKFGLRLTQAQRELILGGHVSPLHETECAIRATPANQQIMLTLAAWEELAGRVASEANNADDEELQKKLDIIFLKIHELLETHADEEDSTCWEIRQPLAEESVQLALWAAQNLIAAERLGIKSKPVAQFPLSGAKQAVIMLTHTVDEQIQKKLAAKHPTLTVGEVVDLLMAVSEVLLEATPFQQFALIFIAKSLMDCLRSEVKGAMKPPAEGEGPGDAPSQSRSR